MICFFGAEGFLELALGLQLALALGGEIFLVLDRHIGDCQLARLSLCFPAVLCAHLLQPPPDHGDLTGSGIDLVGLLLDLRLRLLKLFEELPSLVIERHSSQPSHGSGHALLHGCLRSPSPA